MKILSGSSMSAAPLPSSRRSQSMFGQIESVGSSLHEDIMFVIYSRISGYDIKAFKISGERVLRFCFTIDLDVTHLPFYCGFAAVGPTLYMVGGCTLSNSTYVPNLDTYMIDFKNIPQFSKKSIPSNLVQVGPCLHAKKQSPIVIVVESRIYVFPRYLMARESSNFECLYTETGECKILPEPSFDREKFGCMDIVSHVVEGGSIIICLQGEGYNGSIHKMDLGAHQWTFVGPFVNSEALLFCGRGVCFDNAIYAVNLENRVCWFPSALGSQVAEVDNQLTHRGVGWLQKSEIALMGDTFFVARIGFASRPDPSGDDPDHYLTVEKFCVSMEAGTAKATDLHQHPFKLKVTDAIWSGKSLYLASWVGEGGMQQQDLILQLH